MGAKTAGGLGKSDGGEGKECRLPRVPFITLRSKGLWLEARSSCGFLRADQACVPRAKGPCYLGTGLGVGRRTLGPCGFYALKGDEAPVCVGDLEIRTQGSLLLSS